MIKEKTLKEAIEMIKSAIYTDGAHHKQWFLWQILKKLNLEDYDEAIKEVGKENGIAP